MLFAGLVAVVAVLARTVAVLAGAAVLFAGSVAVVTGAAMLFAGSAVLLAGPAVVAARMSWAARPRRRGRRREHGGTGNARLGPACATAPKPKIAPAEASPSRPTKPRAILCWLSSVNGMAPL
ncbi:hypothetical protein HMPREF9336_04225 [Segniliparus rugosus ATCC BAA-974]|uniref:Uncharacterized protein n=2 Tax=Segniliparus rugosus TaxID=286804 RepID=U1N5A0_SEGRC|nr:hypothetical protein HMPREF9336_04225 [Segniliparus rugosus ATCC BAA-974]